MHLSHRDTTLLEQNTLHRDVGRMNVSKKVEFVAAMVALSVTVAPPTVAWLAAQSTTPAQIAVKLSGHWKLNTELTPVSAKPGRGPGQASYTLARAPVQRGGRGGDSAGGGSGQPGDASSPLMAEEVAAQSALSVLHQVPMDLTIEATADTITFHEPRGEWHFRIDAKNSTMQLPAGTLPRRSRWDHAALRQEFSSAQKKLVKSWSIDANDRWC